MRKEECASINFVDNYSAHGSSTLRLEAVTVQKLQPNTLSVL